MRQTFVDRFNDFSAFLNQEGLGTIRPTQVELNYVNAVSLEASGGGRLERVLSTWRAAPEHHLGSPEQTRLEMSFHLKDLGSGPSRLWVQIGPGQGDPATPALLFTLTVRGMPTGEGLSEVLSFLDDAHGHLVRSFAELTTSRMHDIWRLRR